MNVRNFQFLYHHLILPPKLPCQPEGSRRSLERELLLFVRDALASFMEQRPADIQNKWKPAANMIEIWLSIDATGHALNRHQEALVRAIADLRIHGAIALHINAQNCGGVAHYDTEKENVIIDAFEASATTAAVLDALGPLVRQFPSKSVAIPVAMIDDHQFCEYLAQNVCRLESEVVRGMCPKATEAREYIEEDRDTIHPGLITEGLMVQLLAFGEHNAWKSFDKHSRDDINFENGRLPWRRSPLWFVIKVALQTILYRAFPNCEGRMEYKNFMIYLVAALGSIATHSKVPDSKDVLTIIRAKAARRVCKLQEKTLDFVLQRVGEVDAAIMLHLQNIHRLIQASGAKGIPEKFDTLRDNDLETSLKHSRGYLHSAMGQTPAPAPPKGFKRSHRKRQVAQGSGLPKLEDNEIVSLVDLEIWVDTKLQSWSTETKASDKVCCELAELIENYSCYAHGRYAENPGAMSLMLLVIFELWVSLDKMCTSVCRFLEEFSPELPEDLLEALLLPRRRQMQRAEEVEKYILSRHEKSKSTASVFDDLGPDTFGARYFAEYRRPKNLRDKITDSAMKERDARRNSWQALSKKYQDLISQASGLSHDSEPDEWGQETHLPNCEKCRAEREAANLTIEVHEWPLPADEDLVNNVVFELECPRWFSKWRDITWQIVNDYGGSRKAESSRMETGLFEYPGLKEFYSNRSQRLTLESSRKSWLNTHYSTQSFPVSFENIAVPNALRFALWDREKEIWVASRRKMPKPSIKHLYTLSLSATAYSDFQYAIEGCRHTQNKVMADQRNHGSKLDLHEMSAFGHLRSGERLQWYNIVRELASPSLSMSQEAVHKLLCQAAWELGSSEPATWLREAHAFFEDDSSVNVLWEMLEYRLGSIGSNWNEYYTLHTLVILGLRSLSLGPASAVKRAGAFLRDCRKVAMEWCTNLAASRDANAEQDSDGPLGLMLRLGGICLSTYDVDDEHLPAFLYTREDLQFLVRSSIVLFENTMHPSASMDMETRGLVLSASRVLCHVEHRVTELIESDPSGLNCAIQQTVGHLQISSPWRFLEGNSKRWATNKSSASVDECQQEIHYNILSGELLIDNQVASRLPESFTKHTLYRQLFGSQTLSVVPSRLPGSSFTSSQCFGKSKIHFRLHGGRLIVKAEEVEEVNETGRASKGKRLLRLIPHETLLGDFPDLLVKQHTHWLDLEARTLEFRPLDQAWQSSHRNWCTSYRAKSGEPSITSQGQRILVDVHSEFFARIANVLRTLDTSKHIFVTKAPSGIIEAKLVRLHLNFFVNSDGALECREHNSIVDSDQDIGCLYGLTNKLVLRSKIGQCRRTVLISYGRVRFNRGPWHTDVSIEPPTDSRIRCFHYLVDSNLGMLSATSGMIGTLYQAYLHAVTSFVLPDPLTNRSGTEEALRILRQAKLKSSFPLDSDCVHLLSLIAALTPRRQYYPPKRDTASAVVFMQRVTWNRELGELAQHDEFAQVANKIYNYTNKFAVFHDRKAESPPGLVRGDMNLLDRARFRHKRFHKSGFGGGSQRQEVQPSPYKARDRTPTESARSRRVYEMATLVRDWPSTLTAREDLFDTIRSWGTMKLEVRLPEQETYTSLLETPMKEIWCSIYNKCWSSMRETDLYRLLSVFCTIAFGGSEIRYLSTLLAIAVSGGFPSIPESLMNQSVDLSMKPGEGIDRSEIQEIISACYPPWQPRRDKSKTGLSPAEKRKITRMRHKEFDEKKELDVQALEIQISKQWPCETLQRPSSLEPWQSESFDECERLFGRWNRNIQFYQFLQVVQRKLDAIAISSRPPRPLPAIPRALYIDPRIARFATRLPPSLHDLLRSAIAPCPMDIDLTALKFSRAQIPASSDIGLSDEFQSLISGLSETSNPLRQQYAENLSMSLEALRKVDLPCGPTEFPVEREILEHHHQSLLEQRDGLWDEITAALTDTDDDWKKVAVATLWPSITVSSILSFLVASRWVSVPEPWKYACLVFAKIIASLRRCERLIMHFDKGDVNSFYREAEAVGCEGWEASEFPEWLLFEIESDLTIRPLQAEVALRMITPEYQGNFVLQLNMGEGKTTVIAPMIATFLSNGSQIPLIMVLKPLLRQSVNILSQRLGGLLNRPVYHIPFSRTTPVDEKTVGILNTIYDECLCTRGILIVLPEQLLSFRLVGLDLANNKPSVARRLVEIEQALQEKCRSIIDESDEVLDPKFQLIYTRGNQQNLDGASNRWEVIQYVLEEVEKQAVALQSQEQSVLGIERQGNRYPILHFLETNAADLLVKKVFESIQNGAIPGLPFHEWPPRIRDSSLEFAHSVEVTGDCKVTVLEAFDGSIVLKNLLVLRGLFAHRILRFALVSKRWYVDYGIHPSRCLLAVPFRAKGVPSENAQFGHPEVALILTCLSYYYGGLTEDQVRQCVSLLVKENDPGAEYQSWIARCREELPTGFHSFTGINLDDTRGFKRDLYPHLRYQKGIIDFFLCRVVFPREAKEFPFKLSTSAWDIPSRPGHPLATGFSGTNDNRYLLPTSMPQQDLPYLLHTNAMVLAQLLREENRECVLAEDENGHQLSILNLLHLVNIQDPPIDVIIDVGAQILELSNQEVAEEWLSISGRTAAIFFDDNDEAIVVDREGYTERLLASPFNEQMYRCVVFLDQQHSRGVDLKLPSTYRAAITLGPRLTKDRLVQACHRMRELGNGQSVTFLIPPEVKHSISKESTTFTSFDVLQWVLEQTCGQLERLRPLWAWQGLHYVRSAQIWDTLSPNREDLGPIVARIQEAGSKTLHQLYAPWEECCRVLPEIREIAGRNTTVAELLGEWEQYGTGGTLLHEEQEREICQEVQRELRVCRPPPVSPAKHLLHSHLKFFVKHACFPGHVSEAAEAAFPIFARTSASHFGVPHAIIDGLFASRDFVETVSQNADVEDEFLKPVHWVLSNVKNSNLLIISEHEANELLPLIRTSNNTTLHLYAPRTTKDMRSFSKLDVLSIGKNRAGLGLSFTPEILGALELFSGSLYFDTYTEYEDARCFFGFISKTPATPDLPGDAVTSEGFVAKEIRDLVGWPVQCPFQTSPLPFLNTWYSIRTKGHGFSRSHIGSIIEAKPLTEDRF
ncbi:uncharacterized protein BJX67DRAFT_384547 [Aspergillus lucknowensis]|uniref:ubiquitinyl hydrolase 1 n=1 Tax=Aspergillus lucknowensis TaxID=176173 RepID=A0ABR4LGG7_9EURO